MDAPPHTPPAHIPIAPPPLSPRMHPNDGLRELFLEAEFDIISRKSNSQWVKAWIFYYRFCLKDPMVFALVK